MTFQVATVIVAVSAAFVCISLQYQDQFALYHHHNLEHHYSLCYKT